MSKSDTPAEVRVEPLVRPDLDEALDAWWAAAYAEGRDGREHDTEGGAAQTALQDIWAAHSAQLAAAVAAERERIRVALMDMHSKCSDHNYYHCAAVQLFGPGPNARLSGRQRP